MVRHGRLVTRGDVLVHVLRVVGIEVLLLSGGEIADGHGAFIHQSLLDGVLRGGIVHVVFAVIRRFGSDGYTERGRARKLVNVLHVNRRRVTVFLAQSRLIIRIVAASRIGNQAVGKIFLGYDSLPAGQSRDGIRVARALVHHLLDKRFLHALIDLHRRALANLIVKVHRRSQQCGLLVGILVQRRAREPGQLQFGKIRLALAFKTGHTMLEHAAFQRCHGGERPAHTPAMLVLYACAVLCAVHVTQIVCFG